MVISSGTVTTSPARKLRRNQFMSRRYLVNNHTTATAASANR